jgi:hypothetical protein
MSHDTASWLNPYEDAMISEAAARPLIPLFYHGVNITDIVNATRLDRLDVMMFFLNQTFRDIARPLFMPQRAYKSVPDAYLDAEQSHVPESLYVMATIRRCFPQYGYAAPDKLPTLLYGHENKIGDRATVEALYRRVDALCDDLTHFSGSHFSL